MVEYWLDVYDEKPLEAHRNEDGFIQLKDTGDDLIDRWEEKIAAGEEPDLKEAFSPEVWESIESFSKKSKRIEAHQAMTFGETMKKIQKNSDLRPSYEERISPFGNGYD